MTILPDDELKTVREAVADPALFHMGHATTMLRHIDALTAKLRVAVEALRKRSAHLDCPDPHYSCAMLGFNATGEESCNCGAQEALEALRLIGPLPLPTPLPGEGE